MNCNECGSVVNESAKFCPECGARVKREMFCLKCGERLAEGQKFCSQCGTAVEGIEAAMVSSKKSGKKEAQQANVKNKFKSNVVTRALQDIPGTIISEKEADDIAKIISLHALGAATTSAATAWIPGAGATVATAGQIAFVWTMYIRISEHVGIEWSKKKLKFLGSAILSNVASVAGSYLAATAVSFIPGIGSVTASILMAGAAYGLITIAGIIYLNLMSSLVSSGDDISNISDEELKKKMDEVIGDKDIKSMMKEAQAEYVKARKNGTVSGKETIDLENE